jgi:hypothetical protein
MQTSQGTRRRAPTKITLDPAYRCTDAKYVHATMVGNATIQSTRSQRTVRERFFMSSPCGS